MRIVISGSNGYLGRHLTARWRGAGHDVVGLSRSGEGVFWDGKSVGDWCQELECADALVNLAGRSVNCRYNQKNREEILRSRVDSTKVLGAAIADLARPPRVWVNASTATIYRHAQDRPMDDETGEIGSGFSVDVALAWEKAFFGSGTPTRKVAMRTAMVMGPGSGGPFEAFDRLVRAGMGGRMGDGRQMVSWIHIEDFRRAVEFLIEGDCEGTVNVCAPGPLSNDEFMAEIRRARSKGIGLPSPKWMLEVGAFVLGTETELPLKSRWVLPSRLQSMGFEFLYPDWRSAVTQIVRGGQ
ncbi:MAG TPA: TIGR01777 family oxidoreductase [Fimbriimonadaceae bacterium]|nr:TIGR01777 family oxidoreductase [Fimbriimonadaceae bacterium]